MQRFTKWLTPGIHVKRWLLVFVIGICLLVFGIDYVIIKRLGETFILALPDVNWSIIVVAVFSGIGCIGVSIMKLSRNILAPYRHHQKGGIIDVMVQHSRLHKGLRVVAIGGGTGLPAVLKGLKHQTGNITAIVTVADDGGSSGRLRRDLGVLPPGDLRNNIAALADDDSLLTRLFQYRFQTGELSGHAFGNLFIAALAAVAEQSAEDPNQSSLAEALTEIERVLNIQGRVLPATLADVQLEAVVQLKGTTRSIKIMGESKIGEVEGHIQEIQLIPSDVVAYPDSVEAILEADIIVIGPGSLYTSIIPNLLVKGIAEALRASSAYKVYVCNVATQPEETDGYTMAEHVMALEHHIGRGVFQVVMANNAYPAENAGENTHYVLPAPENHEILQRYEVYYTDLTDKDHPWRHDPQKLGKAILDLSLGEKSGV